MWLKAGEMEGGWAGLPSPFKHQGGATGSCVYLCLCMYIHIFTCTSLNLYIYVQKTDAEYTHARIYPTKLT